MTGRGSLPDIPGSLSMDVGVVTHDFYPWHFDEVSGRMAERMKERTAAGHVFNLSAPDPDDANLPSFIFWRSSESWFSCALSVSIRFAANLTSNQIGLRTPRDR